MRPHSMRQVAEDVRRQMDAGERMVVILTLSPDLGVDEIHAILDTVNTLKGVTQRAVATDEGPVQ